MDLFWKKLFRVITPTAKLEKDEAHLVKAMHRYVEVEKSVELAEYKALFHLVKSSSFQENKKTLKNRRYKDTEEFQDSMRYKKLHNSPSISNNYRYKF